jgi:tetratricopeptide (TPR) repeat protein
MRRLALALSLAYSSTALAVTGSGSPGQDALDACQKALEDKDINTAEQKCNDAIAADASLTDAYWKLASIYLLKAAATKDPSQYKKGIAIARRAPDQLNLDVKMWLGLNLYKDGQTAEAVKILEDAVKQDPSKWMAQLQLGQHFMKAKDPKKAVAAYEAYLQKRPDDEDSKKLDPGVREALGKAYFAEKDYDNAIRVFEDLTKVKPNDTMLKILIGTVYVAKRDQDPKACDKAITIFERILGEANKTHQINLFLGLCYLKNARAADAQRVADLYVKQESGDAKGYVLQGDSLLAQNKPDKALLSFQTAKSLSKNDPQVIAKIGLTDVKLKNYDAAVNELETAQKSAPNDLEVLCALVEAYGAKKLKDKLGVVSNTLEANKELRAQQCAGDGYYLNGNDEKAMVTYTAVLKDDPKNGKAKGNLVKVLNRLAGKSVDKNELPKAHQLLSDAENLVPDDLMTLQNLGLVLLLAKKYAEAEVPLQKALRKHNDLVQNRLLGRALLGQSKRDLAKAAYEKAAQIALRTRGVDLANVYTELGPLYVEAGQYDTAVSDLEVAVKEAGNTAVLTVAQRNLAIAYLARGLDRMRQPGQGEGALLDVKDIAKVPKAVLTAKEWNAVACVEGAAALKAGKIQDAEDAFDRATKGGGCTFKPPWDKVGADFWGAYAGYRDAGDVKKREAAVKKFQSLQSKAQGAVLENLRILIRSGLELLGYDYFSKSNEKSAETNLRAALKVQAKGDKRELEHNLAVLDLTKGLTAPAEKVFETLGGKPCEARANLGIIKDRQGDGKAALDLYRSALSCGARGRVKDWIDVKQRLYGGAQ